MSEVERFRVFEEQIKPLLGPDFDRALRIRARLGDFWTWSMTQVLVPAARQGKADEVLSVLESHAASIRAPRGFHGQADPEVDEETSQLFYTISRDMLDLSPAR